MTHLSPIENLFAVEVPERATELEIRDNIVYGYPHAGHSVRARLAILPPGSYEILFTTKGCTEAQAAGIVVPLWEGCYPDYSKEDHYFSVAILSIQSLLRANGLQPETNYLLIKKIA